MADILDTFEFEDGSDEVKHNPWSVESIEDFRFYNCPECDHKEPIKRDFLKHAIRCHPKSGELFDSLEVVRSKKVAKRKFDKTIWGPKVIPKVEEIWNEEDNKQLECDRPVASTSKAALVDNSTNQSSETRKFDSSSSNEEGENENEDDNLSDDNDKNEGNNENVNDNESEVAEENGSESESEGAEENGSESKSESEGAKENTIENANENENVHNIKSVKNKRKIANEATEMNSSEPKRQTQETTIHQQLVQQLRALQVPQVPNPKIKQSQMPNPQVQQSLVQQSPVQQSQVPKPPVQSSVQQSSVQQPSVQQPPVQRSLVQQSQVPKPSVQQSLVQQSSVKQLPSVQQPSSVQQPLSVQQPPGLVQQPQRPTPPGFRRLMLGHECRLEDLTINGRSYKVEVLNIQNRRPQYFVLVDQELYTLLIEKNPSLRVHNVPPSQPPVQQPPVPQPRLQQPRQTNPPPPRFQRFRDRGSWRNRRP